MDEAAVRRIIDAFIESGRQERMNYHLTLGKLIDRLEAEDPDTIVRLSHGGYPGTPNSYRGYYDDLAFEPSNEPITAIDFLGVCQTATKSVFVGYKGGNYQMGNDTPLWIAAFGICSQTAIVDALAVDGDLVLMTKQIED